MIEWRGLAERGAAETEAWSSRLAGRSDSVQAEFNRRMAGELPGGYEGAVYAARQALFAKPQNLATRKSSQMALTALATAVPELIGGSADLTGSNLTRVPAVDEQYTRQQPGRYIGYGVREFAMAAALNGFVFMVASYPMAARFLCFPTMPAMPFGFPR